ncbi:MAG: glycine zipper 2TM domain-containing protein, partial [Pseudomonadota bacterium]|nr:glycine zipper 2TM domain-containing protein [Pseudomonadota bacterium]
MPRLFTLQRLTAAIAVTLATGTLAVFPAGAETRIETVLGTVTKSDPIRTSYIRKTPSDEKVCETQEVPVYGQASAGSNNENSDLGAMIIGGVIGSAIGNKTSDQDGAGAAGAVVGALLGREHAKKKNQQGG